jgi:Acyl-CoA reductase (LuxC)
MRMKQSISAVGRSHSRPSGEVEAVVPATLEEQVTPVQVAETLARLRIAADETMPASRVAVALGTAAERWRDRDHPQRRETVGAIAAAWGWSESLIEESIDALIAPLNRFALENLVARVPRRHDVIGMIVPGNIPGAGIHEYALGLLAGCALMIKTATAEPFFFVRFTQTLREVDPEVGARVAVLNWGREYDGISGAFLSGCDWIAAFGNDDTIARLKSVEAGGAPGNSNARGLRVGFGSRVSGALVASDVAAGPATIAAADAIARDVSLFEQQGCLSPHHIFVDSLHSGAAHEFARELAAALARLAKQVPPPRRYGLEKAAAVRRFREGARWRGIGGSAVALMEGDGLGWTVVYDDNANFTVSPGYRAVTVSPYGNLEDLRRRLTPVAGRIEAFALAAAGAEFESLQTFLAELDVCYIGAPGKMQSPPLNWNHGGGAFLQALGASR